MPYMEEFTQHHESDEHVEKQPVKDNEEDRDDHSSIGRLRGDQTRFTEYSFGKLETVALDVTGDVMFSGIAMGNPIDGGTVKIPANVSTVILQNTSPYTRLTLTMPLLPPYGKVISIVSTVNVASVTFANATFGTTAPSKLDASEPVRFIFAGSWFNI